MLSEPVVGSYNCTNCTYSLYDPTRSNTYRSVNDTATVTQTDQQGNSVTGYFANDTVCLPSNEYITTANETVTCSTGQVFLAVTSMDVPDYFYGALGLAPVIDPSSSKEQSRNFFYNLAHQQNYVPNFKVNYYRDSSTESSINFGDSYITKETNIYYNAVKNISGFGYWALNVTHIFHEDTKISDWGIGVHKTALIDTSSPYLIIDYDSYANFTTKMIANNFTCTEDDGETYLPVCYNDDLDSDNCTTANDGDLIFTFLGGLNSDVPTNETVPASNYYYYTGTTCESMVTHSGLLNDTDTIVLADPFIITFIISFNLFMQSVSIAPKED